MNWNLKNPAVRLMFSAGVVALALVAIVGVGFGLHELYMLMFNTWGEDMAVYVTFGMFVFILMTTMVYLIFSDDF